MSVQGVKRETATELQQLEAEQRKLQLELENGDRTVRSRLQEIAQLIREKRAQVKDQQQKLLKTSKAHQAEHRKIGIDTAAEQRQAAKETAGLKEARSVRGQISEATAKDVSSNPRAAAVPGHPPDVDLPGAEQLGELVDKLSVGFEMDPETLEKLIHQRPAGAGPNVKEVRAAIGVTLEGAETADGEATQRQPGQAGQGDAQGKRAANSRPGQKQAPADRPQQRGAQATARGPQPETFKARLGAGQTRLEPGQQARTVADGQPQHARAGEGRPQQTRTGQPQHARAGTGQPQHARLGNGQPQLGAGLAQQARLGAAQLGVGGDARAQPRSTQSATPANLSFRLGASGASGSPAALARTTGADPTGIQLTRELLTAAPRSYGTWTDGMLMLWILRFVAEEQSARSDRKELKYELDELQLLEKLSNISDRIRMRRREIATEIRRFFQGVANFKDNYYRARVEQLVEQNPARARQNKNDVRNATSRLNTLMAQAGVDGFSRTPNGGVGPEVLTERELAAIRQYLADNPSGETRGEVQEALEDYETAFRQWQSNSGTTGEVALYRNAMIHRLQAQALGGGDMPPPEELGRTIRAALGREGNQKLAELIGRLSNGDMLSASDFDGIEPPTLRQDLIYLNEQYQEANTTARSAFQELSRSPFARAVLDDMRQELENSLTRTLGEFGDDEEAQPTRYSRLMEVHDIGTQTQIFDDMMAHFNPLEEGTRTGADFEREGVGLPGLGTNDEITHGQALTRAAGSFAIARRDAETGGGLVSQINGILARAQAEGATGDTSRIRGFLDRNVRDPFQRELAHTILTLRASDGHEFLGGFLGGLDAPTLSENPTPAESALTESEQAFMLDAADAMLVQYARRANTATNGEFQLEGEQGRALQDATRRYNELDPTRRMVMESLGGTLAGSATTNINEPFRYDAEGQQQFQEVMNGLQNAADSLSAVAQEHKMKIRRYNQADTRMMQMGAANARRSMTPALAGLLARLMQAMRIARS